jgi:hypothetical protein
VIRKYLVRGELTSREELEKSKVGSARVYAPRCVRIYTNREERGARSAALRAGMTVISITANMPSHWLPVWRLGKTSVNEVPTEARSALSVDT